MGGCWDYEVFLCKPRLLTISNRWLLKTDGSIRGFTISLSKRRISCSYTFDWKHKTDDCYVAPVLIWMMAWRPYAIADVIIVGLFSQPNMSQRFVLNGRCTWEAGLHWTENLLNLPTGRLLQSKQKVIIVPFQCGDWWAAQIKVKDRNACFVYVCWTCCHYPPFSHEESFKM